ncbi:MAG: PhoX family protein [Nitrospirales bacterium]|nr:DUF839 domain-containing protein [Nitrospira sp.]MDR4500023.1 PhoX family protein [Nitrospirales bacterium]
MKGRSLLKTFGALSFVTTLLGGQAALAMDFGEYVEKLLQKRSLELFGVVKPIQDSAPSTVGEYREVGQAANAQVKIARGLEVEYVTREAGNLADMFAFYPDADNPTHLVFCIEGGREEIGSLSSGMTKYNPAVQTVQLDNGAVRTILRGMNRCDGIRRTSWGTYLVTEETSDGGAYEIMSPLSFENYTVQDRSSGAIVQPDGMPDHDFVVKRTALPTLRWEGLTVLDEGVVILGDELRPGTDMEDTDGGAIYKFIPDNPHTHGAVISSLASSPFVSGNVYALQISCRDDAQQFGQGCEIGNGVWLPVSANNAPTDADQLGATGYYRPEDLHKDPTYEGRGVLFCWTNTGNRGADNFAETLCGVDQEPLLASEDERTVTVNRFVEGDPDFNSHDNLAIQPITGIVYVIEDNPNGDIFACLPDGDDRDIKTDGCVKILSVRDSSAEPTGFEFDASGTTAYLSIQHSADGNMPAVDDYPTDDILKITGFTIPHGFEKNFETPGFKKRGSKKRGYWKHDFGKDRPGRRGFERDDYDLQ